jgi:NADPH:quinone reductase-like Zn-dependent oxidoreductase
VAIVPVSALAVYPEKLTPEEGTSIWMQYVTAYGALIHLAHIAKGNFVIITAPAAAWGLPRLK